MQIPLPEARNAFAETADRLDVLLAGLTDDDLLGPSACRGWTAGDVLAHLHLGLAEAITAFAYPTDAPPDADAVTYWHSGGTTPDPGADLAHTRFIRLLASAYARPTGLVRHLRPTLDALGRFVARADDGCVAFQGRTLRTGDFVATWVVEIAIHHLDLLRDESPPPESARVLIRRTLDGLRGTPEYESLSRHGR